MVRIPRYACCTLWILVSFAVARGEGGVVLRSGPPLYVDSKGGALRQPEGVGCGAGPMLAVADTGNGRIVRFVIEEGKITPRDEITLPQLPYPIRVQIDSRERIFALDGKLRRIARIDPSGQFAGYVEFPPASGAVAPRSIAIGANDELYVLDVLSARVLVVDREGAVAREIAFSESHGAFSDVAVTRGGAVLLIDPVARSVFAASPGDTAFSSLAEGPVESMVFPTALTADPSGRIYIADQSGGDIVILGRDGMFLGQQSSMGWKPGFLRYPSGICVDDRGNLFVADRGNNRVQVFAIVD
jgi:sugar lactone lactonase YvrE